MRSYDTLAEYQRAARRRLPRRIYEFYAGGNPQLIARERAAIDRWTLRRRMLIDVSAATTSATLFGRDVSLPLFVAPCGIQGALWPSGELEVAAAAQAEGVGHMASAYATETYEQMAAANGDGLRVAQMSNYRDPAVTDAFLDRARSAGYQGIMLLTQDRVSHPRHAALARVRASDVVDGVRRPRWALQFARRRVRLENFVPHMDARATLASTIEYSNGLCNPTSTWRDLERIRSRWDGQLYFKGPEHPDDIARLISLGADGLVVSTSGGRTAHPAVASFRNLETVLDTVAGRVPVLVDGSIGSGSDIVRALCLGARGVIVGRAVMWGLATAGRDGAREVIKILREETLSVMKTVGAASVDELGPHLLHAHGLPETPTQL